MSVTSLSDKLVSPVSRYFSTMETPLIQDTEIWCDLGGPSEGERFGEVRIWLELLELAATEMAKSFGSHLGEQLSQQLVDALFGKDDDDAFEMEVMARLDKIEGKLDDLISYLKKDFPTVVAKIIDAGFAEATRKQLRTATIDVQNKLRNFHDRPEKDTASALYISANSAVKLGHELLQYGPAAYSAATSAMGAFLSAMSALIRHQKEVYRGDLAFWAKQYLNLLLPFVDGNVAGSFADAMRRGESSLESAIAVKNSLPATIFVAVYGPQIKYTPNEDVYQRYATRLYAWNGSAWQGDQPRLPELIPTGTSRTLDQWAASLKAKIVPWFPPQSNPRTHPHDLFLSLLNKANQESKFAEQFPPSLARIKSDIEACTHLIESCKAMAQLA